MPSPDEEQQPEAEGERVRRPRFGEAARRTGEHRHADGHGYCVAEHPVDETR